MLKKELNDIIKPRESDFNYKLHFHNNYMTISEEMDVSVLNIYLCNACFTSFKDHV